MVMHHEHEFEMKWQQVGAGRDKSSNAPEKSIHAHAEQIEDETGMLAEACRNRMRGEKIK